MRPLRIEVSGLTAFRDPQEVNLEDLDLFVITGPTGAGKSSLLDAMILALYGKIPRGGTQAVREFITQGMAEARILLEFSLDGSRYRVSRRVPRNGAQSATFEQLDGEEWRSGVEGSGVKAVNERIAELLRLNYDAFTKAVVLPRAGSRNSSRATQPSDGKCSPNFSA